MYIVKKKSRGVRIGILSVVEMEDDWEESGQVFMEEIIAVGGQTLAGDVMLFGRTCHWLRSRKYFIAWRVNGMLSYILGITEK
jgi:hypothetical protein